LAATRSQITPRADDRELQTEQAIVGLPPRKLQPDRMDARSWFGMTFAKGSPAWCAMAAVRCRRRGDSAFHNAHASLGVAGHWAGLAGTMAPIVIGEFITDPTKRWRAVRLAVVGTAAAVAHEALHAISELRRRKEQETKLAECQSRAD